MNVTVSIVVPFYNPPKQLMENCLVSLKQQTFEDFEVLLIDDGNEEDYRMFVEKCIQNDSRFKYIRKEHAGVSAARNLCIMLAVGKYMCFIDADDYVENNFLSTMIANAENFELTICGIAEQEYPVVDAVESIQTFLSKPSVYAEVQYINFCANKLFKTSIINNNHLQFDEFVKLGEDALLLNQYLNYCNCIKLFSDKLYHYVPSDSSAVKKYYSAYWSWEQQVIDCQWAMFHKYPLSKEQEVARVHWLYCKFRGAIDYYWQHINDAADAKQIIREIVMHPLFQEFKKNEWQKSKQFFNLKNKLVLYMWCKFDLRGVLIAKKISSFLKNIKQMRKNKS